MRRRSALRAAPAALLALCLLAPAAPAARAQEPPAQAESQPPQGETPPQQPDLDRRPPEATEEGVGPAPAPDADGPPDSEGESLLDGLAEEVEEPPDPRPAFELPVPADQGGGTVSGRADELEFVREDRAVATGRVEIRYQDIELAADRVELDLATNTATASGQVVLDQGPRRITAVRAVFDLDTKTGQFEEASAYVAPDYYFRGREVAKIGEDLYTVTDGMFTSCEGERPDWSFRLGRATVEVEGYARVHDASMRVKNVPFLYTPYIVWPAKSERTSGFLVPEIGYSDRRGAELGLAYYQVLGRSFDTTFHVDTYSEGYLGLGNEFRYRPTEQTQGNLIAYVVRDPNAEDTELLDEWRWKLDWYHQTRDLPFGLRGVVSYHDFSDFEFFRDFERDFDRNTLRSLESRGFVAGDWGPHSLNVLVNDRETFFGLGATGSERTISQAKLPEIEYRLRPTRIAGLPLYFETLSSISWLALDRQRNYNDSYGRIDLFPQVTLPVRTVPWMSMSLSAGGRLTWYSDSIYSDAEIAQLPPEERERAEFESRFRGEDLTRAVPFAGAQIVGPSFSRIFDAEFGGFARFKHVIEPRFQFNYLGDFEEQARVPFFDEVDNLRSTLRGFGLGSTQSGRWSVVNRLLAKGGGPDAVGREILSLEFGQEVSLDDNQPLQRSQAGVEVPEGPFETSLRFTPSLETNFLARVAYSDFFGNLVGTAFSGTHRFGAGNLAATWFTNYNAETGAVRSDQVRLLGGINVLPGRLRLETQLNYDIDNGEFQQQSYVLHWTAQCWATRIEMRDLRFGNRRDTEFHFNLSLKNVGTFLPLTARSSETLP
ncbi:MAG TPA: LPS assembly protein LptD [Thermoanaerobaculia bacterium]|nr:LPS assembly protein LptD [Thermoanaerobaculia bacterium]